MPSNKQPFYVVHPGAGKAGVGSVSASALDFDPAAGGGVTPGSISTPAYGDPRSAPSGTLDSTLESIYLALNSQAVVVVAANGNATNADYWGPDALLEAAAAASTGTKVIFLQYGSYNWDDTQQFNDLRILGTGSGSAVIRSTGNIRIGRNNVFSQVVFDAGGDLLIEGFFAVGRNRFEQCRVATAGSWVVQCSENFFSQIRPFTSTAVHLKVEDYVTQPGNVLVTLAANNTFEMINVNQLTARGTAGGNVYRNIIVSGAPKTAASPVVTIDDAAAVVSQMSVRPTGSISSHGVLVSGGACKISHLSVGGITAATGSAISFTGSLNSVDHLTISSCFVTGSTLLIGGGNNNISDLTITGGRSSGGRTIELTNGSHCIHNGLIAPVSNQAGSIIYNASTGSRISELAMIACTTTAAGSHLVLDEGIGLQVDGLRMAQCTTTSTTNGLIRVASMGGTFRRVRITECVAGPTAEGVIYLGGTNTAIEGLDINTLYAVGTAPIVTVAGRNGKLKSFDFNQPYYVSPVTSLGSPLISVSGAIGSRIEGIKSVNLPLGTAGKLLRLVNAKNCVVDGLDISDATRFGTTTPLITTDTCVDCSIRSVRLDTLGSANAGQSLAAPVFSHATSGLDGRSSGISLVDWHINALTTASVIDFLSINVGFFRSLDLTRIVMTSPGSGRAVGLSGSGFTNNWAHRVVFQSCHLNVAVSGSAISTVRVNALPAIGSVDFRDCYIGGPSDAPALHALDAINVSVYDSTIASSCAVQCENSGLLLDGCTIVASNTVSAKQVLCGYGSNPGTEVGVNPANNRGFRVTNCQILLSTASMNSSLAPANQPLVFFGGIGVTVPSSHGESHVDGLTIRADRLYTAQINAAATSTPATGGWHGASTLAIDTALQHKSSTSSFKDITVNLDGILFALGNVGTGKSVFDDGFDGLGTGIVEIRGSSDAFEHTINVEQVSIKGLSIINISKQLGGVNRCALRAQGVALENFRVDAVATGALISSNIPAVQLHGSSLKHAEFYATTNLSLGPGASCAHLWADYTACQRVLMRNFSDGETSAGTVIEQRHLVYLTNGSSLTDSRLVMPLGSQLPTTASVATSSVVLVGGYCTASNNTIDVTYKAKSNQDMRTGIYASGTHITVTNNMLRNFSSPSSGDAGDNGGGIAIVGSSVHHSLISNNYVWFTWETNNTTVFADAIRFHNCSGVRFIGNSLTNTSNIHAGSVGGSLRLLLTQSSYCVIEGNLLTASYNHRTSAGGIRDCVCIRTTGVPGVTASNNTFVTGNAVYCTAGGTAYTGPTGIFTESSAKPDGANSGAAGAHNMTHDGSA